MGISTFVWVLHDRISPRFLVVDIQHNQAPVLRGAMPELWVPIVLLSMVALGILLHQLTVRMRKLPDA